MKTFTNKTPSAVNQAQAVKPSPTTAVQAHAAEVTPTTRSVVTCPLPKSPTRYPTLPLLLPRFLRPTMTPPSAHPRPSALALARIVLTTLPAENYPALTSPFKLNALKSALAAPPAPLKVPGATVEMLALALDSLGFLPRVAQTSHRAGVSSDPPGAIFRLTSLAILRWTVMAMTTELALCAATRVGMPRTVRTSPQGVRAGAFKAASTAGTTAMHTRMEMSMMDVRRRCRHHHRRAGMCRDDFDLVMARFANLRRTEPRSLHRRHQSREAPSVAKKCLTIEQEAESH